MPHMSMKHPHDAGEPVGEGIDLGLGVVESERSPHHALRPEAVHQRLGTVVSRAHGYAEAVEQGAYVEVVDAADICLEIPQFGTKHSLNVAVSAALAVYQLTFGQQGE